MIAEPTRKRFIVTPHGSIKTGDYTGGSLAPHEDSFNFGDFQFWQWSDPPPHPGLFTLLLQTKNLAQINPRTTLAPPRRDPWVTLGSPKGHPIPVPIPNTAKIANRFCTNSCAAKIS